MNFINAIKQYHATGDRTAIDMIRNAMDYNYLRSSIGMAFDKPEMYVAFRCLRLIGGRLATIKYTLADQYEQNPKKESPENVFSEFSGYVKWNVGIDLTVENFPEHAHYLSGYLKASYLELRHAYEQIIGSRESLWMQLTQSIVTENWPTIMEALEHALLRVDTDRSEREIVRYINYATRTAYIRNQFSGMRRVRRGGKARYVTPSYFSASYTIFGPSGVNVSLSERQRQLIDQIRDVVESDYKAERMDEYAVDIRGYYRIKNRYIARRLNMHEASLSRALGSIRNVKH